VGQFVNGIWQEVENRMSGGRFVRPSTHFRNWITADGSPGPSGGGGFPAQASRYHLYVSLACPWAHRTLIFRALKKLEDAISVTVVSPLMGPLGWTFATGDPDTINGKSLLSDIYLLADPHYSGRVSVPVLWDKERRTIVSNESSEIIRMLNTAFAAFTDDRTDYYPHALRAKIDDINKLVYENINNGVYRTGFAGTQEAYEEAFRHVFDALDHVEHLVSQHRYLVGNRLTEADWRLFTTLVRFDAVYYSHFKCNLRRILDYPNLSNYLCDLYQVPRVAPTVDIAQIKRHYYGSHRRINPTGIVPLGPALDFTAPHDRDRFAKA
jgi:putative glutathione S-transferase